MPPAIAGARPNEEQDWEFQTASQRQSGLHPSVTPEGSNMLAQGRGTPRTLGYKTQPHPCLAPSPRRETLEMTGLGFGERDGGEGPRQNAAGTTNTSRLIRTLIPFIYTTNLWILRLSRRFCSVLCVLASRHSFPHSLRSLRRCAFAVKTPSLPSAILVAATPRCVHLPALPAVSLSNRALSKGRPSVAETLFCSPWVAATPRCAHRWLTPSLSVSRFRLFAFSRSSGAPFLGASVPRW